MKVTYTTVMFGLKISAVYSPNSLPSSCQLSKLFP